jgi:hypothetical protein
MNFSCHVAPEFIGVDPATLQTWLTISQQALQDLATGGKPVTLSYAQGDGSKSVTYTPAQISLLEQRCRNLARALGLVGPRRAIGVRF